MSVMEASSLIFESPLLRPEGACARGRGTRRLVRYFLDRVVAAPHVCATPDGTSHWRGADTLDVSCGQPDYVCPECGTPALRVVR